MEEIQEIEIVDIPGFPGYGASRDGRIWSKLISGRWRKISNSWRELKSGGNGTGYRQVHFYKDTKQFVFLVHRIIAQVFIGEIPLDMEIAHKNGIRCDNRVDNLMICSHVENQSHRELHGTITHKEKHGMSKLNQENVNLIRQKYLDGQTQASIARDFNVQPSTIHKIVNYQRWK